MVHSNSSLELPLRIYFHLLTESVLRLFLPFFNFFKGSKKFLFIDSLLL